MMLGISEEIICVFLGIVTSTLGNYAFQVSIQTDNSLPVIGEDFTLICSFTPETRYRRVEWTKGDSQQVASHFCQRNWPCASHYVRYPSKFNFLADNFTGNLTIKSLNDNDGGVYHCSLSSTDGNQQPGSSSIQVRPFIPAPPNRIFITTGKGNSFFCNNFSITNVPVIAGGSYSITCGASRARPPAKLQWRIPDGITIIPHDQSDIIRDGSYISQKAFTIIPSRNDQGKILSCVASHPEIQDDLQCSINLNFQVWPMNMFLFLTGGNQIRLTYIYVQEDSPTLITCKAIGSFPAVELSLSLHSDIIPITNSSKTSNLFDEELFDTETTIKMRPTKTDHGKYIKCYAFMDNEHDEVAGLESAKLMVYGLPIDANITIPADLHDGMETNVTCRTSNGYPAPLIHWYIGSRNLTDNSSLEFSLNIAGRYDAVSTLTFVPNGVYHGQRLLCQAVQPETPLGRSLNDSMVLNISYGPIVSITFRQLDVNGVHVGFTLKCTSDANPLAFKVKWFCDCTELQGCHNKTVNDTMIEGETVTSTELTIGDPLLEDHCEFRCVAISTFGEGTAVLNSSFYVLPSRMLLFKTKDEQKYESQPTVIYVQEDSPTSITCKTTASLPETELSWTVFGGRKIILNNSNHVNNSTSFDNSLFDTESTIMIHPDTKTHGMSIQCNASMDKELVGTKTVQLIVYGPPHEVTMTFPKDVNDGIAINITCRAFNGYPAPLIHWYIGSRNVTDDSSQKTSLNVADRYDAESTLVLVPNTILDHAKRLLCQAVQPSSPLERSVNESIILNISSLPDDVRITIEPAVYNGMETNVTCKAVNGYPAPVIHWYIGSRNVTGHSSMKISVNSADRYDAESTLTFTPNRFDHGKYILCQAVQPTSILNLSMNGSMILNILSIPHPQSWIIVDENETASSTLFVDCQPVF